MHQRHGYRGRRVTGDHIDYQRFLMVICEALKTISNTAQATTPGFFGLIKADAINFGHGRNVFVTPTRQIHDDNLVLAHRRSEVHGIRQAMG